ncbi:MAG: pantoate--beta-alanine ligase [Bacteroidales bacterium]|nr:pantoate--beta-alanine ligase [Bacteroidales bacterium]
MQVFETVLSLQNYFKTEFNGKSIAFIPTMGALHQGHLSLIKRAKNENDIVVVSIFVNPTQFNNANDLKNYPRNLDKDLKLLERNNCDLVFTPSVSEIYPDENSKKSTYNFGKIVEVMEGKFRPGHFDGVANVVSRLFKIIKPDNAYFGQKDFQQYILIKTLADKYLSDLNIQVHRCPIIREEDGLAMSSRNVLLSPEQRKSAALISQTLFWAKDNYQKYTVDELKKQITNKINADKYLKIEYIEFVSDPELNEITNWGLEQKIVACIAVQVGDVRLIDNIYLS